MTPSLEPRNPDERRQTDECETTPEAADQEGVADESSPLQHRPVEPFPYRGSTEGRRLLTPGPTPTLRAVDDGPDGDPGSFDCPACGTDVVNGAGLFACPDCSWTGRLG